MAGLTIGEVAARCGVSVRALRLYEAQGLLRPARSLAGRRCYQADDLARMHNILVLKRAGWKLAEIAPLLRQGSLAPARLIDMQIALVQRRHAELGRALGSLRAARTMLAQEQALTVDVLCDLIKTGEQTMTDQAWNEVFARYYTPEELAKWREAKGTLEPAFQEDYGRQWQDVITRVERAIAGGTSPADDAAIALAREWIELQRPMVDMVGAQTWNTTSRMYQEMDGWQSDTLKAPFSQDVYQFVAAAAEAGRARGLIAPRVSAA